MRWLRNSESMCVDSMLIENILKRNVGCIAFKLNYKNDVIKTLQY